MDFGLSDFDLGATRAYYVDRRLLTPEEFDKIFEDTVHIRALGFERLDWQLLDHLLSGTRFIDLEDHLRALSVGGGFPYRGVEDFYRTLIERGIVPASALNRTVFYRVPQQARTFDQLLVDLGLLSRPDLDHALHIKETIRERVHVSASLGQILRSVANLSMVDYCQILGIQNNIPFVSLDESAPRLYAATLSRTTGTFKTSDLPSL